MTDIEMFEDSAKWNCDRGFGYKDIHMTCHEAYVIITRLRQAEKDAARYRWLRDESNLRGVEGPLVFLTDADGEFIKNDYSCVICAEGDNLDSAIDEAMNGSNN